MDRLTCQVPELGFQLLAVVGTKDGEDGALLPRAWVPDILTWCRGSPRHTTILESLSHDTGAFHFSKGWTHTFLPFLHSSNLLAPLPRIFSTVLTQSI